MFLKHWLHLDKSRTVATSSAKEPVAKRLVLKELQNTLSAQLSSAGDLDGKLKQLLNSASLILSIVTTLQITTGIGHIGWLYLIGLSVALSLYVYLIVVIMRGLKPVDYYAPIPRSWDEIAERYFDQDESAALSVLISTYLDSIDKNNSIITNKSQTVKTAATLLVIIVVTLLIMGIVGLGKSAVFPWQSPLPTPSPTP